MTRDGSIEIRGVAAVIMNPCGEIAVIRENESKRSTHKLAGMESIPMETQEPGETKMDTLKRMLFDEELGGLHSLPDSFRRICQFRPRPHVKVDTYALYTDSLVIPPGSGKDVGQLRWVNPEEVLKSPRFMLSRDDIDKLPNFLEASVRQAIIRVLEELAPGRYLPVGKLRWRPGVEESILSHRTFRPLLFKQTIDQIPDRIFDHLANI